jgi:electron transport complex protein RnfE
MQYGDNMKAVIESLKRSIITENPVLVLILGLCPLLAMKPEIQYALIMGVIASLVLAFSNVFFSLAGNFIPDKVRFPAYIVITATFINIAQLLIKVYIPTIEIHLILVIPLLVINAIIHSRSKTDPVKNSFRQFFDGIIIGLGFTVSFCVISFAWANSDTLDFKVEGNNLIPLR